MLSLDYCAEDLLTITYKKWLTKHIIGNRCTKYTRYIICLNSGKSVNSKFLLIHHNEDRVFDSTNHKNI